MYKRAKFNLKQLFFDFKKMPCGSVTGLFTALKNTNNDIPHAIAAFAFGCYAIVAYD